MSNIINHEFPCWCGSAKWEVKFSQPGYQLLHCTNCGVFRNDPPPVSNNDENADFYTSYYEIKKEDGKMELPATKNSRFWKVADKENILAQKDGTVLDLGCGDGGLCGELKADGWGTVIGIDVSKKRIINAKNRYPTLMFFDVPISDTNIKKESIDLIIMDNVIEHIPVPQKFIEELLPYLKPSGKMILITPNMRSGNFRLLGKRWTPELCPHAHVYLFTIPAINKLTKSAGFQYNASGSFHLKLTSPLQIIKRLVTGGPKAFLWKLGQVSGDWYGRIIGQGQMLYNITVKN